jgi:hypothetical protein
MTVTHDFTTVYVAVIYLGTFKFETSCDLLFFVDDIF